MVLEALTAVALVYLLAKGELAGLAWLGLVLLLGIWVATAVLSVPCHHLLSLGHDVSVIERLINTNWVRTVLWTLRGLLVVVLALKLAGRA